jgi:hypothetical protein
MSIQRDAWVFADFSKNAVVVNQAGWTSDNANSAGVVTSDSTAKKVSMPAGWTLKVAPFAGELDDLMEGVSEGKTA